MLNSPWGPSLYVRVWCVSVRKELQAFDNDHSGTLDAHELSVAFETLQKINHAHSMGSVPFSSFPPDAQEELKSLDEDGCFSFLSNSAMLACEPCYNSRCMSYP